VGEAGRRSAGGLMHRDQAAALAVCWSLGSKEGRCLWGEVVMGVPALSRRCGTHLAEQGCFPTSSLEAACLCRC
jgi:hypothetical protein